MPNKHNQTDPKWLTQAGSLGTGVFIVPNVQEPGQSVQKEFVEDITYQECVKRAVYCVAFKWVPHNITLNKNLLCGSPCVETCVEAGCVCFDGTCK
jgi:hypothetical protein